MDTHTAKRLLRVKFCSKASAIFPKQEAAFITGTVFVKGITLKATIMAHMVNLRYFIYTRGEFNNARARILVPILKPDTSA